MKTAVEWLLSQLNKQGFAQVVTDEEIDQALKMEQKQMIDKYQNGYLDSELDKLMKYKSEE
jgi:hypothetical protein